MNRRTALPLAPSAQRHRMLHPWLTSEAYAAILSEAKKRDTHVDRLAALLLCVIAQDDLFEAVLGVEE